MNTWVDLVYICARNALKPLRTMIDPNENRSTRVGGKILIENYIDISRLQNKSRLSVFFFFFLAFWFVSIFLLDPNKFHPRKSENSKRYTHAKFHDFHGFRQNLNFNRLKKNKQVTKRFFFYMIGIIYDVPCTNISSILKNPIKNVKITLKKYRNMTRKIANL